jgi:hypothetical protein
MIASGITSGGDFWFGAVTLASTAVAFAALVALHLLPTGLSPWRAAVSQYGISAYRAGYRVMTISMGIAGVAAAAGFAESHVGGRAVAAGAVVSLVVFGCARIVISWFPMDAPGAERTAHGTAHWLLAVVTFAAIASAAFELRRALSAATPPDHSHIAGLVHWLSWLLLVAVAATVIARRAPALREWFGTPERLIYVGIFAFLTAAGILLLGNG